MQNFSATEYFYLKHRAINSFFLLIKTGKNTAVLKSPLSTLEDYIW